MKAVFVICVWCFVTTLTSTFELNQPLFLECPTISTGFSSPYCKCKHGPAYDAATNTCPSPECPPKSIAEPSYPNCTCTEVNFDYSEYLNECFRVCPENSSGYWPKCVCDDKLATFNKKTFSCVKCPDDSNEGSVYPECNCENVGHYNNQTNKCIRCIEGSTGIYPKCTCIDTNAVFVTHNPYYSECEKCPPDSSGQIPNCICDNGSKYNELVNSCAICPYDSTGDYPNCECLNDGYYDGEFCQHCPYDTIGSYPNCTCSDGAVFVKDTSNCLNCPSNGAGTYPSCVCEEPLQYDMEKNECLQCPENSNGIYPNCTCESAFYWDVLNVCIECPSNSKGIYPDCVCTDKDHVFSAYINQCYIGCQGGSSGIGKHPYCDCGSGMFYKAEEFQCKSNVGRECPPDSIGIGPDCLCAGENQTFTETFWRCIGSGVTFAQSPSIRCPDRSQKYPQCSGIDPNALKSLVG